MSKPHHEGLLLPGLDGTNPLGFLAALGLLRLVTRAAPEADTKMAWMQAGTSWAPRLYGDAAWVHDGESLLGFVTDRLERRYENHPFAFALGTSSDKDRSTRYRLAANEATAEDRDLADWLAAVGSDAADADANNQLQTVRRDYLEGNLRSLIGNTTEGHLRRSLLAVWDMADPLDNHSLHLNPTEDRRHAYQWSKPSGDPDRKRCGGMIGANRLAIEAWALLPLIPCDITVRTVGFTGTRSTNTRWTWPLWSVPVSLRVVRSLLALSDLQATNLSADSLAALGVAAVYRSQRILVGKTPNFTPAARVG